LGVTENPYTEHKPEDLKSATQSVHDAVKKRQEFYASELKRVQENDKLAREFAAVANPLVDTVNKNRDSVNESKESLEHQEKHVTGLLDAKLGHSELKTIQELQQKIRQCRSYLQQALPLCGQRCGSSIGSICQFLKQ